MPGNYAGDVSYVSDVLDLLLNSRSLESLTISTHQDYCNTHCLWFTKLLQRFKAQSDFRMALKRLHLGVGCANLYRIDADAWDQEHLEPDIELLSAFTDLEKLEHLRLDNKGIMRSPVFTIAPGFLTQAVNLRSLVVDRFSPDILELVRRLTEDTERPPLLNSLEVVDYFDSIFRPEGRMPPSRHLSPSIMMTEENCSTKLDQSGFHWRKLVIGHLRKKVPFNPRFDSEDSNILRAFVANCRDLEELHFPLHEHTMVNPLHPSNSFLFLL